MVFWAALSEVLDVLWREDSLFLGEIIKPSGRSSDLNGARYLQQWRGISGQKFRNEAHNTSEPAAWPDGHLSEDHVGAALGASGHWNATRTMQYISENDRSLHSSTSTSSEKKPVSNLVNPAVHLVVENSDQASSIITRHGASDGHLDARGVGSVGMGLAGWSSADHSPFNPPSRHLTSTAAGCEAQHAAAHGWR